MNNTLNEMHMASECGMRFGIGIEQVKAGNLEKADEHLTKMLNLLVDNGAEEADRPGWMDTAVSQAAELGIALLDAGWNFKEA